MMTRGAEQSPVAASHPNAEVMSDVRCQGRDVRSQALAKAITAHDDA